MSNINDYFDLNDIEYIKKTIMPNKRGEMNLFYDNLVWTLDSNKIIVALVIMESPIDDCLMTRQISHNVVKKNTNVEIIEIRM